MHSFNKSIGHIPVLISDFRKIFPKISGIWVDGTFGFGGYSKYLLEAGVEKLIVIDVDPDVKQHIGKTIKNRNDTPYKNRQTSFRHRDTLTQLSACARGQRRTSAVAAQQG